MLSHAGSLHLKQGKLAGDLGMRENHEEDLDRAHWARKQ